jgi:hypothetical protein
MDSSTFLRVLENEAHRHIVEEVLILLEKHPISVGAAKNILDAASAALNFAPALLRNAGNISRSTAPSHLFQFTRSKF